MKAIKLIIPAMIILSLCGCKSNSKDSSDDWTIMTYTDSKTCVEYIKYACGYVGGITVRYNADGTIKLNKECLDEKD